MRYHRQFHLKYDIKNMANCNKVSFVPYNKLNPVCRDSIKLYAPPFVVHINHYEMLRWLFTISMCCGIKYVQHI